MNSREFFYLVAEMRSAQKRYFKDRQRSVFLACRKLENMVDAEIMRAKAIDQANNQEPPVLPSVDRMV